jgi:hypothetical protein
MHFSPATERTRGAIDGNPAHFADASTYAPSTVPETLSAGGHLPNVWEDRGPTKRAV